MSDESLTLAEALAAATAAAKAGDYKSAGQLFLAVHQVVPDRADIVNAAGAAIARADGMTAAVPWLIRAADLEPANATYRSSAGVTLAHLKRFDEALPHLEAAVTIEPANARALEGLGLVALSKGDAAAARGYFERAIAHEPHRAIAINRLGQIAMGEGDARRAVSLYDRACQLDPNDEANYIDAAFALDSIGRRVEAIARLDALLARFPSKRQVWPMMLLMAVYTWEVPPCRVAELHKTFAGFFPTQPPHPPVARPVAGRRIRVGYVSADFRNHVGAMQLYALFSAHDRKNFEIVAYMSSATVDETTRRFEGIADIWRPIHALSDDQVADLVRSDGIDILVDLIGHFEGMRLGVFAHRPAPVQVSMPGYIATTGVAAIDYRITDAVSDPSELDQEFYSERLVRLPEGHFCFKNLTSLPAIGHRPYAGGGIVFGSFHKRLKYDARVVEMWAAVLDRVPGSRLLLKHRVFGSDAARAEMLDCFAACGIGADRIELVARTPSMEAHYRSYDRVDIALDPFPYNGTTTSMDALQMGVPVVALRGDRHVARLGANILTRVGLGDLIAETPAEYVEIAARLAADHNRRADLRGKLRAMVDASPIIQAERVVRPLEAFYRDAVSRPRNQTG